MTRSIHAAAIIAVVTLFFCLSMLAQAAVPSRLNYQGYLTDTDGSSIDGNIAVTFSIYTTDLGGTFVWTDTELITVDQGLFSVELGADNPFPSNLFATPLWLGVAVGGDDEMLPRRPLTTVGFAFQADDALSLQGQTPAAFDQAAHVADMSNPHGVDAAQTGAATSTDITSLQAQLDAAFTSIASLQADLTTANANIATLQSDLAAEAAARIADIDAEEAARIAVDILHDTGISDIQGNTVLSLNGVLTRPDSVTALFSGVNLQVVSGSGATNGAINGLGNLIVGYNAPRSFESDKSGSHNIVVGDNHNYSSYGGLVAGVQNTISHWWATVSGGSFNTASGPSSSVSGGESNVASGNKSSVSGGEENTADADGASVSGGQNNSALENWSSISGGYENFTTGEYASVSGGFENSASGESASVSGGQANTASGDNASVTGGRNNVASGGFATVAGGGGQLPGDGNEAIDDYSLVPGADNEVTYAVGDIGPAGGYVFHITDGGAHGLEAALVDQAGTAQWGCNGTEVGADGLVVGTGAQNTGHVVAGCMEPNRAARIADAYVLGDFDDWFLPSRDELNLLYTLRFSIGGFDTDYYYWSSSEDSASGAYYQYFADGVQGITPKTNQLAVRAVRAF